MGYNVAAWRQPGAEVGAGEETMPERAHMEHDVRKALHENEGTAELDISVKYVNGVVFLDGVAPSAEVKQAAAEVVGKVEGVTFVQNRLQIKPEVQTTRDLFREGDAR